jgi:hypothetical protein
MEVEQLPSLIENNDIDGIKQLMEEHNLSIIDGKIITNDKNKADELSEYFDMIQLVRKVNLNGSYGAMTNPASNFFDTRLGASCTLGGRCTTRHMASKINEILGDGYKIGKYIIAGDTDSSYFTIPKELKETITKEEFIELTDQIGNAANASFPEFYNKTFNVSIDNTKVIKCAREICAQSTLFIKKKRYAALVYDEKNFRYDVDGKDGKLKIMGLDIKRADCPVWVQDKLKLTIDQILAKNKTNEEIIDFIREWRNKFLTFLPWEMGIPKRVNNLTSYTEKFVNNVKGVTIPGHVRASINWNMMLKEMGDIDSMKITDGFKVIVCKLRPNNHNIDSIAYPIDQSYLPDWFKDLSFDIDSMVEVAIDKKVENIFGVLGIDLKLTAINSDDGFEWD